MSVYKLSLEDSQWTHKQFKNVNGCSFPRYAWLTDKAIEEKQKALDTALEALKILGEINISIKETDGSSRIIYLSFS